MGGQGHGAYGFRLVTRAYEGHLPGLLPLEEGDGAEVALEWRYASNQADREEADADHVALGQRGWSLTEVHRDPAAIMLDFPEPVMADAVVHPLLTPAIAVLARWRGDVTLHAGAFHAGGRAWGVVGQREAGKSTMLATLAERGCPILADDLLVLSGTTAHAGPNCIDLRPDVAAWMPGVRFLGQVAGRLRYRLSTPLGPTEAELGGFFLLDWNDDQAVALEPLDADAALKMLYEQEYFGLMGPADPRKILDLLETPMWRVSRPPDREFTDETISRILEITSGGTTARSPASQPA